MCSNPLEQVLCVKTSSDHLWHVNFFSACNSLALQIDVTFYSSVLLLIMDLVTALLRYLWIHKARALAESTLTVEQ